MIWVERKRSTIGQACFCYGPPSEENLSITLHNCICFLRYPITPDH